MATRKPKTQPATDFPVTFFYSHGADRKDMAAHSFDSLAALLKRPPSAEGKEALPWIKLAHFGEARTNKGSLRHDANVEMLSGVEADYDLELVQPAEAARRLRQSGVQAIVYTSPSHSPEQPRWRVLCPLSRVYEGSPDELRATRTAMLSRVQGVLGKDCPLSNESWVLSQSYYYGHVEGRAPYECIVVKGTPVDALDGLPELGNQSQRRLKAAKGGFDFGVDLGAEVRNLAAMGEDVHGSQLRVSASMAGKGAPVEAIVATMQAGMLPGKPAADAPLAERERWQQRFNEIPRVAQSAVEKFGREQTVAERVQALLGAPAEAVEAPGEDFWNAAEMAKLPPPQWLVRGLVHRAGLCVMYGEPGSGKSALAFAVAMALGGNADPVLGDLRVVRHGAALYYALEGNLRTRTEPYFIEGKVTGRPKVRFERKLALSVDGDDQWNELHDLLATAKAGDPDFALLVVDTLARASDADENTADLGKIADTLHQLSRKFSIAVILVHHSGKDAAKGARGHSSLKGAVDTEIEVTVERDALQVVTKRTFKVSKQRDGEEGLVREFVLGVVDLGPDPDDPQEGVTGILCQVKAGDAVPAKVGKARLVEPQGKNQRKVYKTLVSMLSKLSPHQSVSMTAQGEGVPVDALLDAAKEKFTRAGDRDRRREVCRDALDAIPSEFVWLVEEGGVQYAVLPAPVL